MEDKDSFKKTKTIVLLLGHLMVWSIQLLIGIETGSHLLMILGTVGLALLAVFGIASLFSRKQP